MSMNPTFLNSLDRIMRKLNREASSSERNFLGCRIFVVGDSPGPMTGWGESSDAKSYLPVSPALYAHRLKTEFFLSLKPDSFGTLSLESCSILTDCIASKGSEGSPLSIGHPWRQE